MNSYLAFVVVVLGVTEARPQYGGVEGSRPGGIIPGAGAEAGFGGNYQSIIYNYQLIIIIKS